LLADDHRLVVEACAKLLEPECDVVATVKDGRSVLRSVQHLRPDVVVLDIGMPLLNGLDAGRQLKKTMPGIKIIFMTMNEDPDLTIEALRMKASGYLLKTSAGSELLEAIRAVVQGRTFVTSQAATRMEESFVQNGTHSTGAQLTLRQREVLQLLAEGYSMKRAGTMLNVTARTIAFHKYRIMEQFRVRGNAGLIQLAIKQGLVLSSPCYR
jgi:DNA-binding NarL/FixJ family response regulator